MAIEFVGWGPINTSGGNQNFQNSGGNVTPALPSGIQAGDLIVLFCMNRDGTNATGFSALGYRTATSFQTSPSTPVKVDMLFRFAPSASPSNPTVSTSGGGLTNDPTVVLVGVWRGIPSFITVTGGTTRDNPTSNAWSQTASGSSYEYPAITFDQEDITQSTSDMLLVVLSAKPNDYTAAPSDAGGYTTISTETTLGGDASLVAGYQIVSNVSSSQTVNSGNFGGNGGNTGTTNEIQVFESPNIPVTVTPFPYTQIILLGSQYRAPPSLPGGGGGGSEF